MPVSDFRVNLANFSEAKAATDNAARHYGRLAKALEQNVKSVRDGGALSGGFGATGHFQGLLDEFGNEWSHAMDEFVAEEHRFVAFLHGFSARLQETHDLYHETDSRGAGTFDNIARTLNSRNDAHG
jgi:hypothetical protein